MVEHSRILQRMRKFSEVPSVYAIVGAEVPREATRRPARRPRGILGGLVSGRLPELMFLFESITCAMLLNESWATLWPQRPDGLFKWHEAIQNGLLLAARVDSQTIKSAVASATRSEFLTARSSRSSRAHAAASVGRRGHREVLPHRRRLVVHGSFSLTTERRRRRARRQLRAASRRHRHFEKWRPRRRPNVLYLECRPRWLSQSAASAPLPKVPGRSATRH